MEVTVSARHTEVPERLRRSAEEKIGKLGRFVEGMDRAEVHFSTHRNPRIAEPELCEVTLEGHGHFVRAKVAATDGYVAIDKAVAKLEQQLHKLKTKLQRQKKGTGKRPVTPPADALVSDTLVLDTPAEEVEDDAPALPKIVKVKRFAPMGMTADEAAQRMDLLGHGFFFFTNLDTGRAAVVYRREDGDIGLIDEDG
ncbi:MAG TPA: ribosome-associated translation inhibitor RaiA [Iamia sp.]|nr:ribosome-associated translation inhibitor RaiA [Iamia sp.]